MPKPIKKRIDTRQRVLDEEKVKTFYEKAHEYYTTNKNVVIASLLVVAIVLFTIITYFFYSGSTEDKLLKEEAKAYQLMYDIQGKSSLTEQERLKKAVEHYKKALEIKQDHVTILSLGHAWFKLSELDKALETYDNFIKEYPGSKLVPVAYQMKAKAYQAKGDSEQALMELDKLANYKNGIFQDTAFFKEAQILESNGKKEEAIKKYEELVSSYPASLLVGQAKARLAILKPKPEKVESGKEDAAKKEGEPGVVKEQLIPIKTKPKEEDKKTETDAAKEEGKAQDSEELKEQIKINESGKEEQQDAEPLKEKEADTSAEQQVPEKKKASPSDKKQKQSTGIKNKDKGKGSEETGKDKPPEKAQPE